MPAAADNTFNTHDYSRYGGLGDAVLFSSTSSSKFTRWQDSPAGPWHWKSILLVSIWYIFFPGRLVFVLDDQTLPCGWYSTQWSQLGERNPDSEWWSLWSSQNVVLPGWQISIWPVLLASTTKICEFHGVIIQFMQSTELKFPIAFLSLNRLLQPVFKFGHLYSLSFVSHSSSSALTSLSKLNKH